MRVMPIIRPEWEPFSGVIRILDDIGIPYMVVGSVAASFHGLNRATHDVDLVVALRGEHVSRLVSALKRDYYIDEDSAYLAQLNSDLFNAIDNQGLYKIDFWVLSESEFSRVQFERRIPIDSGGARLYIESAEDTILSKLLWNKITHSERQIEDAKAIVMVQRDSLDYDYLRKWAVRQGVWDELNKLLEEQ